MSLGPEMGVRGGRSEKAGAGNRMKVEDHFEAKAVHGLLQGKY